MSAHGQEDSDMALMPFELDKHARSVSELEARLSRGFLLSEPAKWFPGFDLQWIPLMHSFGVEVKVREVRPALKAPQDLEVGFAATVDDEAIAIVMNNESALAIVNALCPTTVRGAENVLLEYMARRLVSSLAMSWSGPESTVVNFDSGINYQHVRASAAALLDLTVNGRPCHIWILLGKFLVERLDGLWKRQVRSTSKQAEQGLSVSLEATQLAVPPAMLSDYMKSRAIIDLEVQASDKMVLRSAGEPWNMARMCDIEGKLGFEIINESAPMPQLPEGTTRISIEFGRVDLDAAHVGELTDAGAIYQTDIPLSTDVNLMINDEQVSRAELMVFEGRLAMRIK